MHTTERVHYFRDENDDRTMVTTVQLGTGLWKARMVEGLHSELGILGYGPSRLAAMADMQEKIEQYLGLPADEDDAA